MEVYTRRDCGMGETRNNLKMENESFQQRMQTEFNELALKIGALESFLNSKKANDIVPLQRVLLFQQWEVMKKYLEILGKRIGFLNKQNEAPN